VFSNAAASLIVTGHFSEAHQKLEQIYGKYLERRQLHSRKNLLFEKVDDVAELDGSREKEMSTSEVFSFDTPRMSPRLEISKTAV
jgi:hypothetical protein